MALSDTLLKLVKLMHPTGRAFKLPFGSVIERLYQALNDRREIAYNDAVGLLDSIIPDNDNFSSEDADIWELRLGLNLNSNLDLADRKAAIYRKMSHPSDKIERQHYLFIQHQLQLAGFNVWVYENRFDDGAGGFATYFLNQFIAFHYNQHFSGTFQHGDQQHGGWNMYEKVVNYLTNTEDAAVNIVNGRQTFFIGGDKSGKYANVKAERETEFRHLILKLKPLESAALLAIQYGDGVFDDLSTSGVVSAMSAFKIHLLDHRCFYQDKTGQYIRCWNLDTDTEITNDAIGSGTIIGLAGFTFYNGKVYVTDNHASTKYVRVFNHDTGAAIPSENFGAGDMSAPYAITCYNGEAYVADNTDEVIYVFDIATKTKVREISASDSTDGWEDLEIFNNKLYAQHTDASGEKLYVFDLDGNELIEETQDTSGLTGTGIAIENGFLYLCCRTSNLLRVYNVMDKIERVPDLDVSGLSSINYIAVSKNRLVWIDTGGSPINIREKNT